MGITKEDLVEYLQQATPSDLGDVDDEMLLFSSGLVDSFAMVDLLLFVEREGGFRVAPLEVSLENFDSVGRILRFVESRQASANVS